MSFLRKIFNGIFGRRSKPKNAINRSRIVDYHSRLKEGDDYLYMDTEEQEPVEMGSNIRFRITDREVSEKFLEKYRQSPEKVADDNFNNEQHKIIAEAKALIHKLLINHVSRDVIKSWLYEDTIVSRLRITKHFDIILPDYNNMEIKMTPLEKTVYLFFLKHENGCLFKELIDYKADIMAIYSKLAKTDNAADMEKSINYLCDPYGASLSEKCAKIKGKFLNAMPDEIAYHYYIQGGQGQPKLIPLDRAKVEWEG